MRLANFGWRTFGAVATLTVALAAGMLYSAPGSGGRPSSSPALAGVITADPAEVVGSDAPVRSNPPVKGFTDRPTIPLDTYKRIKETSGTEKEGNATQAASADASAVSPLAVTNSGGFNGPNQGGPTGVPPDINGAVSRTDQIAAVVNRNLLVWTKALPPSLISNRNFATLTGDTADFFAPRILFDPQWKRWVISIDSRPVSSTQQTHYLLFSKTENAAGAYYVYSPNAAAAEWCGTGGTWSYPQIGMTQDAVIVTGNCFNSSNAFTGARVFGVAKAVVYNGGGFSVPKFALPASDGTVTPPVVKDANPHAHLLTRSVHNVTFANPQGAFYGSIPSNVPISGFFTPSVPRNAGQTGCTAASCQLDTGDGRFVAPSSQYGDHLWNVATYGLTGNGTRAIPSWGDFDIDGGGVNTTKQRGRVSFDSCADGFNASLAVGADERVWLNWSSTDPQGSPCGSSRARMMIAGRTATTPVNTMSNQLVAFTSCCTLTGNFSAAYGSQRWGGTSSVSIDPLPTIESTTAWAWNETVTSSSLWGTRAQQVNNP